MAKDDKMNEKAAQDTQQTRRIRFTEEGIKTQYSGVFNLGLGSDEVIFMFGNSSIDPSVVRIESKIVVSLKSAKRIAASLNNLVRRYEAINGVIDISPSKKEKTGKGQEKPIQ